MYPHRIHLRGPWDYEPLRRIEPTTTSPTGAALPPAGTMRLPCRWSDGGLRGFRGVVRFRRRFGRPARLDAHERLWLVCEGADAVSHWYLNGDYLGSHVGPFTPFEFDITERIEPRNDLSVEVACHDPTEKPVLRGSLGPEGGLWGSVAVEVRGPADLTDLAVWTVLDGQRPLLHADGLVRTFRPADLELHLLLDDALIHRQATEAALGTAAFRVDCPLDAVHLRRWPDDPRPHLFRLELIERAVCWHRQTFALGFRRADLRSGPMETLDLLEPIREAHQLAQADRQGRPILLRLPTASQLDEEARCQYRQIVRGLAHHVSIAAWVVAGPEANTLAAELRVWDPTRPALVEE